MCFFFLFFFFFFFFFFCKQKFGLGLEKFLIEKYKGLDVEFPRDTVAYLFEITTVDAVLSGSPR